eukprot:m.83938 g.83938  ORF g.83938 m.83938 type:complete len:76 (-) comp12138_c1_seq1:33-260(-)
MLPRRRVNNAPQSSRSRNEDTIAASADSLFVENVHLRRIQFLCHSLDTMSLFVVVYAALLLQGTSQRTDVYDLFK